METNMDTNQKFPLGRNREGTLNDLKEPKECHYNDCILTKQQRDHVNPKNVVGDRKTITEDLEKIKKGQFDKKETLQTETGTVTRFTVQNRSYLTTGSGKICPEAGSPGTTQLNKCQTGILSTLNEKGLSSNSKEILLNRQNSNPQNVDKAIGVWQKAKGKNVSSQEIDTWKRQYASEYKKKNSPTLTQSKSLSQRKR